MDCAAFIMANDYKFRKSVQVQSGNILFKNPGQLKVHSSSSLKNKKISDQ